MFYLIITFIFIFGLLIGSFLNCLIWRLHTGEGMWNRSYCPRCRKQIAWHDNIPVLSFIILKGKCRGCHQSISWQYPTVELIIGLLFAVAFYYNYQLSIINYQLIFNLSILKLLRDFLLISVMTVIFIYDLRWYLILDKVTVPAFIILSGINLILGFNWQNLLLSVIIGGGFFLIQFLVSNGKWIGGGDIRLGALMGASLGYPSILTAVFIAYILGSIIGVGLIIFGKKQWGSKVPFGTFLAVASIIVLFWGDQLVNWYWSLFKF